jgi:hypothetical protein
LLRLILNGETFQYRASHSSILVYHKTHVQIKIILVLDLIIIHHGWLFDLLNEILWKEEALIK